MLLVGHNRKLEVVEVEDGRKVTLVWHIERRRGLIAERSATVGDGFQGTEIGIEATAEFRR